MMAMKSSRHSVVVVELRDDEAQPLALVLAAEQVLVPSFWLIL